MWTRKTLHTYADEILGTSLDFRTAYMNRSDLDEAQRSYALRSSSEKGVAALRSLALAVRAEQDFGIIPPVQLIVGAFKPVASDADVSTTFKNYQPPYSSETGFQPLFLREALNKIAHADPSKAGFYANDVDHDLIFVWKERWQCLGGNHFYK